jgi:hypothetical protein
MDGMQHGMNQDLFAAEARFPFAQEEVQQRYDSCLSHRGDVDSLLGPQVVPVLTTGSCPCGVFSSVPQQGQQPRLGDPLSSWKYWPRPHRWPPIRPAPAQKLGPTVLCMCFDSSSCPWPPGTLFFIAQKRLIRSTFQEQSSDRRWPQTSSTRRGPGRAPIAGQ